MDALISDLVGRYEQGRLSRRELVAGLAALSAVGTGSACAQTSSLAPAPPPLVPTGVDHVSMLVSDLDRSTEFYGRVFGLVPVNVDEANKIRRLGVEGRPGAIVSIREEPPAGVIDHIALRLDGFDPDATTPALQAHGLDPQTNLEFGYYVRDPDGAVVQLV